ncbi:hypothetical protein PIIN_09948 [Serendipita indica DSM 11827]|uniref:Uncharacterized protein n=1 Tax=Serendipita indica (strain DSM 11827) TaxID=1109443 RepID=G4TXA9_SERID|nr:hypothetical protein PIIN_09948 [Serendipita indica DSM 11827]
MYIIPIPMVSSQYSRERDLKGTAPYEDRYWAEDVTIKVIKAVQRQRREVTIFQHLNILPVYGIVEDPNFGSFDATVTPWCLSGNAAQCLYKYALLPHWKDIL